MLQSRCYIDSKTHLGVKDLWEKNYDETKARMPKHIIASVPQIGKPLRDAGIFMGHFEMLVTALHTCVLNGQINHEDLVNLLRGLGK